LKTPIRANDGQEILRDLPHAVAFRRAGSDLLLQGGIQLAKGHLSPSSLLKLALRGLKQAGIVDRDSRLGRQAHHDPLGSLAEHTRLLVAEEEPAQHGP
jgi:hypothetical protein